MSLDSKDVNRIAHLARLSIDEADIAGYAGNLSDILNLVEQMNSVETDAVSPMAHPLDVTQRLREDTVTEQDRREVFQKNAPEIEAGLFLVPQVIE